MLFRSTLILGFLLTSQLVSAAPVFHSIEPPTGPVTGGTEVLIRGTGFTEQCFTFCPGFVRVFFGRIPVPVRLINSSTILVVSPSHIPGTVPIEIRQSDGAISVPGGFTYVGNAAEVSEIVLVPLFVEPVRGAFRSRFITELGIYNGNREAAVIQGIGSYCQILCPYELIPELRASPLETTFNLEPNGTPGRLLYLRDGEDRQVRFQLRVRDESRAEASWGTEVPVVREREFFTERLHLVDIPTDTRFRRMLRVYSRAPENAEVIVRVYELLGYVPDGLVKEVRLTLAPPQRSSLATPAYAELSIDSLGLRTNKIEPVDHQPRKVPLRIEVEAVTPDLSFWAFVSITSNETQHVTLITPQ